MYNTERSPFVGPDALTDAEANARLLIELQLGAAFEQAALNYIEGGYEPTPIPGEEW